MPRLRSIVTPVALACLGFLGLAGGAAAQDESATAVSTLTNAYPVAIHEGTCADLTEEVAWEIGDATPIGESQEGGESEVIGSSTNPVLSVSTAVDVNLEDLGNNPHAIVAHQSQDDDTIVACGEIGGANVDGRLVVALAPTGDSLVSGVVTFDSGESGFYDLEDGQTQVTAYVTPLVDEADPGTPEATTPEATPVT